MEQKIHQLSFAEVKDLCQLLDAGEFEEEVGKLEYTGRMTSIYVDESEDGCVAYYSCVEDTPKTGVDLGSVSHAIKVGDYIISATEKEFGLSELNMSSDSNFCLPENSELIEQLKQSIERNWKRTEFCGYYDACQLFEKDWTEEEIIGAIQGDLSCKQYILIDDKIYGIEEDLDSFFEWFCDGDEDLIPEYTEITPREAAERLAFDIDISAE